MSSEPVSQRNLAPPVLAAAAGLRPSYDKSWAVVIGINTYRHVRKLEYAVNDAVGMAELLEEVSFGTTCACNW
jgi:hypothetical protein